MTSLLPLLLLRRRRRQSTGIAQIKSAEGAIIAVRLAPGVSTRSNYRMAINSHSESERSQIRVSVVVYATPRTNNGSMIPGSAAARRAGGRIVLSSSVVISAPTASAGSFSTRRARAGPLLPTPRAPSYPRAPHHRVPHPTLLLPVTDSSSVGQSIEPVNEFSNATRRHPTTRRDNQRRTLDHNLPTTVQYTGVLHPPGRPDQRLHLHHILRFITRLS